MNERRGQKGVGSPREARNIVIDAEAVSAFEIGDRVFHQKFGYGEIMAIEGDKLTIEFDKAGEKKVVASFVTEANAASDDVPF
jgi:DNA helicase-2/ATP-dependent DNA helicase PcrA